MALTGTVGRLSVEVTADTSRLAGQIQRDALAASSRTGVMSGRTFASGFTRTASMGVTASGAGIKSSLAVVGQSAGTAAGAGFSSTFKAQASNAGAGLSRGLTASAQSAGAQAGSAGGSSFASSFAKAATLATAAIGALGIGMIVKQGIQVAAANESAAVSFEVMLGSAEKAQAFLKDLQGFAATTPFEFPELRSAASRLIALGVETERIIPIMTTMGDATAGMGTNAEGVERAMIAIQQMANQGRVMVGELNQMATNGVPIWDMLAAKMKMTPEELRVAVEQNKVGIEDVYSALEQGGGKMMSTLTGTMEKQSQTLEGLFSTLKDEIGLALGDVAAPLVDSLRGALPDIATALGGAVQAMRPMFASLGDLVKSLTPVLEPLGKVFGTLVSEVMQIASAILDGLAPAFAALGGPITRLLQTIGQFIVAAVGPLSQVIGQVLMVLGRFIDILTTALQPVIAVWPALIKTIADAFMPLIQVINTVVMILAQGFAQAMQTFLPVLQEVMAAVGEAFKDLGPELAEIAKSLVPVAQQFAALMPVMAKLAVDVIKPLIPLIGMLARVMAGQLAVQLQMLVGFLTAVSNAFFSVLPGALQFASTVTSAVGSVVSFVLNALADMVQGFSDAFGWVPGLGEALNSAASGLRDFAVTAQGAYDGTARSLENAASGVLQVNGAAALGISPVSEYGTAMGRVNREAAFGSALLSYKDAVDQVTKAFKGKTKVIDADNAKGRDQIRVMSGMAQATKSQMDATSSMAQKVQYAGRAVTDLEKNLKGVKMDPATQKAMIGPFQDLITELDNAGVDVSGLQTQLDRIKSKTIKITIDSNWSEMDPAERAALMRSRGGIVRGPGTSTSDSIPAWLSDGEYVLQASAVRKLGVNFLDALNDGVVPQMPSQGSKAYRPPQEVVVQGSGKAGPTFITTITNPEPEKASESLPSALRRAAFAASWSAA